MTVAQAGVSSTEAAQAEALLTWAAAQAGEAIQVGEAGARGYGLDGGRTQGDGRAWEQGGC